MKKMWNAVGYHNNERRERKPSFTVKLQKVTLLIYNCSSTYSYMPCKRIVVQLGDQKVYNRN